MGWLSELWEQREDVALSILELATLMNKGLPTLKKLTFYIFMLL